MTMFDPDNPLHLEYLERHRARCSPAMTAAVLRKLGDPTGATFIDAARFARKVWNDRRETPALPTTCRRK